MMMMIKILIMIYNGYDYDCDYDNDKYYDYVYVTHWDYANNMLQVETNIESLFPLEKCWKWNWEHICFR